MAPLTWRNVDAPSFSGPNEMWKLAATLMNQGFDSARRGINDFRDITTAEQSAKMMQDVIAAGNDPAAIQAAVAGGNSAYLSPAALEFANRQPGVLLDRQQAEANIAGTGLQNQIRGQQIRVNDFDFANAQTDRQRADERYALMPEAISAMTNLRSQMASGALTGDAANAAQREFLTRYGQTLGITDAQQVGSFFSNNQTAQTTQQGQDILRLKNVEQLGNLIRDRDARGIASNVLTMFPNVEMATRAIQGFGDMDPELKTAAIAALAGLAPAVPQRTAAETTLQDSTLFPTTAQPRVQLPGNYRAVIMQNNGTRNLPLNNNLNAALNTALPQLGLTAVVTSGGQVTAEEQARGLGDRTGSTRHDHGGAADLMLRTMDGRILSWENPQDVPQLQQAMAALRAQGLTGFGAGPGYMNPQTTHVGYGTPAVWGDKGGRPYQALLDAFSNNQKTITSNNGRPTVENARATAAAPQYQAAMDAITNGRTYEAPIDPNRPQLQNADGTVSTERTFTTEIDGAWFNIPTVVNGIELPEEQALAEFRRGMNPAVGVYQNLRQAEQAAEARTDRIGQMLAEQSTTQPAAADQAQQQQNDALTNAASPSLAQTTETRPAAQTTTVQGNDVTQEIRVNDRWTIPAVDTNASQASQDIQTARRNSSIDGVLESIKTDLAVNQGGGPLANWAGSTWDYFMADPQTARDNAAARDGAETALSWYQSDVARTYFRQNPGALTEAAADPVGFQQRFQTQTQREQTTVQTPANTTQTPTGQSTPAQRLTELFTRRDMTGPEAIEQMFSEVSNTGALNAANSQYASITQALQSREHANESAAQTASRLTGDNGPLKAYAHNNVTQAIQAVRSELGVSPAVAGALLEEAGNYRDGFLGFGRGYDTEDMAAIRTLWENYQTAQSSNRGVTGMTAGDMTRYQEQQVTALRERVTNAQATLRAAIRDPNTPAEQVALYEQQLAQLPARTYELLSQILASGAVDSNLRNRVPQ